MVNLGPLTHNDTEQWNKKANMDLYEKRSDGSHFTYLSRDGMKQITETLTRYPDDDIELGRWFGADDFWANVATNIFTLVVPDDQCWATQRGNHNTRT